MARRPTITTEMVNKIRELYEGRMRIIHIAEALGISQETARRYATPAGEKSVKKQQRKRYLRDLNDPAKVERRRAAAREYARRQREKLMADPNRPPTKRELARQLKAERVTTKPIVVKAEPGVERTCCVCGVKFRTIYRNTTCSPEHRDEHKARYLRRWKAERAGGIDDDGSTPFGAAGGGVRVGAHYGE